MKTSQHKALAQKFLQFLHEPESQKIIAKTNIMKPVIQGEIDPLLTAMPKVKMVEAKATLPNKETIKQWLTIWQQSVSQ